MTTAPQSSRPAKARPDPEGIVFADAGWDVPQVYLADPLILAMFEGFREKRLLGAHIPATDRVIFPPQSICEVSFKQADGLVEIGPGGVILSFSIVHWKWGSQPTPFVVVYVQFDGASTAIGGYLRNAVTDPSRALSLIGSRCRAVFTEQPGGQWSDYWFELED